MKEFLFIFLISFSIFSKAQTYFPPQNNSQWDTISPSNFNWCQDKIDSLYIFLDSTNTKSFILLIICGGIVIISQPIFAKMDISELHFAPKSQELVAVKMDSFNSLTTLRSARCLQMNYSPNILQMCLNRDPGVVVLCHWEVDSIVSRGISCKNNIQR